ncbi:MAG: flagellar protein FlgN [Lachnospiraceae bacterium]|nr:flagellar protein FlgN [Lachnospiraceae bacterium]
MASLMEELISTLSQEKDLYVALLPIAEEKTKAIVANDLERLQEITDREQEAVGRVNALERKRNEVINNMGIVLGRKPRELTLTELIRVTEKQPKDREMLSGLKDELGHAVKRLADLNERNQVLIQHSLEMIEFNMNLVQSTRMVQGNNYTKSAGESELGASQTGMFDAKQ